MVKSSYPAPMIKWIATEHHDNHQMAQLTGPMTDFPCAAGKKGFVDGQMGKEGDQATPTGTYPFRQVFYRPDKISKPISSLKVTPISPDMGWCDDPDHPYYNRLVSLPFSASHEKLWREDDLYDLILVIGHNDDPVVKGLGSAIFLHVARDGFQPTMGCLAFDKAQLLRWISLILPEDTLQIQSK